MMLWAIIGLSWAALFLVVLVFALAFCRVSSEADGDTERLREAEATPDLRRSPAVRRPVNARDQAQERPRRASNEHTSSVPRSPARLTTDGDL